MKKEIKSLTFPPLYKHLFCGALMRSQIDAKELEKNAKEAHALAVKALEFIRIGNGTLPSSVILLAADAFVMNMVANIYPELEQEMVDGGTSKNGLNQFFYTMKAICEVMCKDFIDTDRNYGAFEKVDTQLDVQETYSKIMEHIMAINTLVKTYKS